MPLTRLTAAANPQPAGTSHRVYLREVPRRVRPAPQQAVCVDLQPVLEQLLRRFACPALPPSAAHKRQVTVYLQPWKQQLQKRCACTCPAFPPTHLLLDPAPEVEHLPPGVRVFHYTPADLRRGMLRPAEQLCTVLGSQSCGPTAAGKSVPEAPAAGVRPYPPPSGALPDCLPAERCSPFA